MLIKLAAKFLQVVNGRDMNSKVSSKPRALDFRFNNFIGAINYFKIISTISTGPK